MYFEGKQISSSFQFDQQDFDLNLSFLVDGNIVFFSIWSVF